MSSVYSIEAAEDLLHTAGVSIDEGLYEALRSLIRERDTLKAELVRHERLKHYLTRKNTPEEDELEVKEHTELLFNIRSAVLKEVRYRLCSLCREGVPFRALNKLEHFRQTTVDPWDGTPQGLAKPCGAKVLIGMEEMK